ncbi:hypothetical protein SSP24_71750 [Streptomyces spinoverrucosus]|uniref:DUF6879 domain-containing protein n=1 Tax=Streptomyces spinoverrucosus TaxID=284043 RepID=A0A4Y3VV25_9ACTN|nr:DUF6879 family protein [Streptomyces spinoverrucosus]GEC09520.1 hypothetical protein SSP24_71750 [Streptomyces spinoverrucosus]GHB73566.1 hypothetical protein GCM10010397_49770 [Streptomyces spinoverrucosus]
MLLDGEAWADRFKTFQTEAWRLETLPQYLVPQEAEEFAAFKAGARFPGPYEDAWTAMVRTRNVGRVHIVTRPLTDYLRFEFERYYQHQAPAGEDIRILDITDRPNPLPDVQDFWMFDRSTVVLMKYEADGTQIERELYEGDPAPFLEYQRIAVAESVPFLEYVTE